MDEQVRGIEAQLHNMEQDLTVLSEEIRDRIEQMTQEVERKVNILLLSYVFGHSFL